MKGNPSGNNSYPGKYSMYLQAFSNHFLQPMLVLIVLALE